MSRSLKHFFAFPSGCLLTPKKSLLLVALLVSVSFRLFYYASASQTHSLDKYFLPVTPGQDFFQIPNAAYSFLRGGNLQGDIGKIKNAYINCCGVNKNVYHPFFTLLAGIPLQLFQPWNAFNLWMFAHLTSDILITVFLLTRFKNSKYLPLALIVLLTSNFGYYEIVNNQYHFLLNTATFFLLYEIDKKQDSALGGIYYLLGLLVKPIGIFWALPLLRNKYFKTVTVGLAFFAVFSLIFLFVPESKYYFNNLFYVIFKSNYPDWNIFLVLGKLNISPGPIALIKLLFAALLAWFSIRENKPAISIFLWIIYTLTMYQNTFPYHFSIVPVLISLALLSDWLKFNWLTKIALFFIIIPAPITISSLVVSDQINLLPVQKYIFVFWSNLGLLFLALSIVFNLKNSSFFKKNQLCQRKN